jgi:hypothetical protein
MGRFFSRPTQGPESFGSLYPLHQLQDKNGSTRQMKRILYRKCHDFIGRFALTCKALIPFTCSKDGKVRPRPISYLVMP